MSKLSSYLNEKLSLECHDKLNPILWVNNKIKPEVRTKLLQFADTWAKFANIPTGLIEDVIMVGGNANYNYTKFSDIDVHVIVPRSKLGPKTFIDDYLQDKKVLWTLTHDIKIYGYSVEPYAQEPTDHYPVGQGIYSLKSNEWIHEPVLADCDYVNDIGVERRVVFYSKMIDKMIKDKVSTDSFTKLRNKFSTMRGAAIAKGGEFSFENLVFKELRNRGYLDKMNNYTRDVKDRSLSL